MAAGDWTSGAGLGDANIAVASRTIRSALHQSIKAQEVMGHPVMQALLAADEGLGQLMGELGVSISLAAIGQGVQAATAEGTEATPTNFATSNSATVTPARTAFARDVSDYARSLQDGLLTGVLSPSAYALLVYDGMRVWQNSIVTEMLALATSFTNSIGTTGLALSWSAMQNGIYNMKDRGVTGRLLAITTVKGATDLANDALSLGGAVQMAGQVQQFINNGGDGAFIGTFFGNMDLYINSSVATSGGDTVGAMISTDGILMKSQRVPLGRSADVLSDTGFFTQEIRRPGGGLDRVETVSYRALGIVEQARVADITYVT